MCTIWTRRNARVNLPVTSFAGVTILTPHRAQKTRAGPGQPESRATPSDQQRAHRLEGAAERVEDEAEDLEGDDAEQRFRVARLPEDDRRVPVPLGKREVALHTGRWTVVPSASTNSISRLGTRPMACHTGSGRSE